MSINKHILWFWSFTTICGLLALMICFSLITAVPDLWINSILFLSHWLGNSGLISSDLEQLSLHTMLLVPNSVASYGFVSTLLHLVCYGSHICNAEIFFSAIEFTYFATIVGRNSIILINVVITYKITNKFVALLYDEFYHLVVRCFKIFRQSVY